MVSRSPKFSADTVKATMTMHMTLEQKLTSRELPRTSSSRSGYSMNSRTSVAFRPSWATGSTKATTDFA